MSGLYKGRYCVDGLTGDGEFPPFKVFDVQTQSYGASSFKSRKLAERWMRTAKDPVGLSLEAKGQGTIGLAISHRDDMLRALLDGKTIQHKTVSSGAWHSLDKDQALRLLVNQPGYTYRVKPEPAVYWLPVWPGGHVGLHFTSKQALCHHAEHNEYQPDWQALRLEIDPDTLEVISAKTEAP